MQSAVIAYFQKENIKTEIFDNADGTHYEVPELYRSVGIAEIEENNWALTPSKYIEFIDHDLEIGYGIE